MAVRGCMVWLYVVVTRNKNVPSSDHSSLCCRHGDRGLSYTVATSSKCHCYLEGNTTGGGLTRMGMRELYKDGIRARAGGVGWGGVGWEGR